MLTFAQLLRAYVQRAGISDAELARRIGISRQTIFRWKEGNVAHPQRREDILQCANKLRLTPAECDLLLLTAGFIPQATVQDLVNRFFADLPSTLPVMGGSTGS